MSSPSAAADVLCVLVADSNRMQARLLTNALRRRPEFRIATCRMETNPFSKVLPLAQSRWPCSR